jgi:tRNA-2-methylthio-N6-dimethylallyladenosine synthase
MDRNYALLTFGCQMNLHDAEHIRGVLEDAGWSESRVEDANAVVLLTCCVRASAERRLYGRLSALKSLSEERGVTIAVGGCLAQKEGVRLMEKAPYVDIVFGTHQYPHIAALLEDPESKGICSTAMNGLRIGNVPSRRREDFRAWITITHGCDNYCSYCIVPYVRGREDSRTEREIVVEAGSHVSAGVKEINLLGQNVNSFRRKEEGESRFADLLRLLGKSYPEPWIRFMTSHPKDFDENIMRSIAETPNVCEYVHLPLQAGSDRVLEAMNRGYGAAEYLQKIKALRAFVKGVSLSTDIIVGFPGETEKDFQATMDMVDACGFDASYTFVYNPREGTDAARLDDDVDAGTKSERLERLMRLTRELTSNSLSEEVGREHIVLVYGPSRKDPGRWSSRTRSNKLVHFQRKGADLVGRFARVTIIEAGSWSLKAEMKEVMN